MIKLIQNGNTIFINVKAQLFNSTLQPTDLIGLKKAIEMQCKKVFHKKIGMYNVNFELQIDIINRIQFISPKKILLNIVNPIKGNNPAEADMCGLRVKLNREHLSELISNKNFRTMPHEIGHLFGWNHPHANATYESINQQADILEQQLTENERKHNLMSQTWYSQKAGLMPEDTLAIHENQLHFLIQNYNAGLLNKNMHLNYFLFWKKIV